jgi:hypothetical protein
METKFCNRGQKDNKINFVYISIKKMKDKSFTNIEENP